VPVIETVASLLAVTTSRLPVLGVAQPSPEPIEMLEALVPFPIRWTAAHDTAASPLRQVQHQAGPDHHGVGSSTASAKMNSTQPSVLVLYPATSQVTASVPFTTVGRLSVISTPTGPAAR
jgi:hypothetical protein